MKKTYISKLVLAALLLMGLTFSPYTAEAQQAAFVRLQPVTSHGTISANGGSVVLLAAGAGGFGSVKVQTLDSYSGTWEVRCSLDGLTYDSDNPLKLQLSNGNTTVYSVTDVIGIWDVQNAAGCKAIKVLATAGFAATDTVVYINATESGGGGGGSSTVDLTGATFSGNLAASATGSAVPAQAGYTGFNSGGNLVGVSNANPLPIADAGGSLTVDGTITANAGSGTFLVGDGAGSLTVDGTVTANIGTVGTLATAAKQPALGTAGTASTDVITVQGIASGTNLNVNCQVGCTGGTTDVDDGTIAGGQTTAIQNALGYWWDGSNWKRITFGTAGTASAQTLTVQGIASMTPILTTLSGTNAIRMQDGSGNALTSLSLGAQRAITVSVLDGSGNQVTAFSGSGGTASNFGSVVPSAGTAAGFDDGTNMRMARVSDCDTGAGAYYCMNVNNVFRTSGTPVEAGTSSNPWNVVFPSAQLVTLSGTNNIATVSTVTTVTSITNAVTEVGAAASGSAKSGNPVQVGSVFNTTQPTVTNGQVVENQATARGAQIVATGVDTFNVTVSAAIAAGNNNIGDVDVASIAAGNNNIGDVDIASALPAGTNAIGKLAANDGVDIGDVTINNASGASAVNVQDGGNSLTVDYATTGSGSATGALRVELANNGTGVIATVGAVTSITNALPTGSNQIGKLAANNGVDIGDVTLTANSGIDIGDVDVTSIIPGTGATNLGKAEDATHASGDVGLMTLCVRSATTPSDRSAGATAGDYVPCQADANGRVYNNDSIYTPNGDSAMNDTADSLRATLYDTTGAAITINTDPTQGSTTSGQSGPLVQGAVTTSAPTYTSGQTSPFSLDTSGSLRVSVVSGSTGNAAASNTGSAVPTQAGYTGVNVAGTLRGMTGVNPTGSVYAGQVDLASVAGATTAVNSGNKDAGTQRIVIATDQPAVPLFGTGVEDVAETADGILQMAGSVRRDTMTSSAGTTGDNTTINTDSLGRLWITGAQLEDGAEISDGTLKLLMAGSVRRDAAASSAGTDGDFATLNTDASGRLWVNCGTGCSGGTTDVDDATIASGQTTGLQLGLTQVFDGTNWKRFTVGTAGTAAAQVVTVQGIASGTNLNVTCSNCSGTGVSVNEDVASANADPGTPAYSVRNDTVTGATSANGDYQPLKSDLNGRLWVSASLDTALPTGTNTIGNLQSDNQEDSGASASGFLSMMGAVRHDAAASSANADNDNTNINTDALGLLWTRHLDPCDGVAKVYVPFSISATTTTQIIAASASNFNYICAVNIVVGAANNVSLVEDNDSACASPSAGMAGGTTAATGWNFAANGGLVMGTGAATVAKTANTNRYSCLMTSGTGQVSGTIAYVQAP